MFVRRDVLRQIVYSHQLVNLCWELPSLMTVITRRSVLTFKPQHADPIKRKTSCTPQNPHGSPYKPKRVPKTPSATTWQQTHLLLYLPITLQPLALTLNGQNRTQTCNTFPQQRHPTSKKKRIIILLITQRPPATSKFLAKSTSSIFRVLPIYIIRVISSSSR